MSLNSSLIVILCFFFFNDTATTEIYTLSLHDALPIFAPRLVAREQHPVVADPAAGDLLGEPARREDRKSTRLNSSHDQISYAVFCLKKTNNQHKKPYLSKTKNTHQH